MVRDLHSTRQRVRKASVTRVDRQCAHTHHLVNDNAIRTLHSIAICPVTRFVRKMRKSKTTEVNGDIGAQHAPVGARTHRRCVNVHMDIIIKIVYNYRLSLHKMMTRYCVAHSNDRSLPRPNISRSPVFPFQFTRARRCMSAQDGTKKNGNNGSHSR